MYYDISGLFIGLRLPFDLVIMSEDKFNLYKDKEHSFTHKIVTTGQVIYKTSA